MTTSAPSTSFEATSCSRADEGSSFSSSYGDISVPGGVRRVLPARTPRVLSSASTSTFSRNVASVNATPMRTPNSTRTPGSSSSCLTSLSSNVVFAIVEGRGMARGEIGVASMDFTFPVLKISQFSDSQSYVKLLNKLDLEQPAVLLVPHTLCRNNGSTNLLYETITENSRANINLIQRRYFSNTYGLQYIRQLCLADLLQTIQLQLQNKYYALAAVAALIKYAEFVQNVVFAPSSLKVEYVGCEQIMFIDSRTAKYLELVENLVDPEGGKTLYGVINYTQTFGGMRLLRSTILQPPFDHATVSQRLVAVSELVAPEHEQLLDDLRSLLSRWPGVERVISMFVHRPCKETKKTMEHRIDQFCVLKQIAEAVPGLQTILARCSSPIFLACRALLLEESFLMLKNQLDEVINEDMQFHRNRQGIVAQRTLLIKEGVHEMLDVCRQAHNEVIADITECVTQLSTKHSLPLKLSYNSLRGYHIQVPASFCNNFGGAQLGTPSGSGRGRARGRTTGSVSASPGSASSSRRLPPEFIKAARFHGVISCTTNYLISLNNRAKDAENEVLALINQVLLILIEKIRPFISCLYKLAESIAMIDLLVSLADASVDGGYVHPRFEGVLALKKAKHPILNRFMPQSVVPNDVFAEPGSNFVLITGPNMGGKSTYLKQIALIQIMAQIGCFVPASFATLRLTDRLFARLDTNDDIETNLSSFMLEVREMSYILANITLNSLVIVDEFGRATTPDEGFGISFAVCEELLMSKAFTFFATHFTNLSLLTAMYPNVESYCFELERSSGPNSTSTFSNNTTSVSSSSTLANGRPTVTHRLRPGVVQTQHYGIQLVQMTLMPKEVIDNAKIYVKRLDALRTRQRRVMEQNSVADVRHSKLRIVWQLVQAAHHANADVNPEVNVDVVLERLAKLKSDLAQISNQNQ